MAGLITKICRKLMEIISLIKGIWGLLLWSSNCCSKGRLVCCHRCQEERRGMLHNTSGRRTCTASCVMSPSNDTYIWVCNLHVYSHVINYVISYIYIYTFSKRNILATIASAWDLYCLLISLTR